MISFVNGNALHIPLADRSVQCVITSPPYFGLRDYGTAQWSGGDPKCDHKPGAESRVGKTTLQGGKKTAGHKQEGFKRACKKCGAIRVDHQIGNEETPAEYVEKLVNVMREVKRVLRDNGTLWLNLGDSYATHNSGGIAYSHNFRLANVAAREGMTQHKAAAAVMGAKEKDLLMIPALVALALRADGWYLRKEIIWNKPNPMPESATDRPTSSHEKIYLLSKNPDYFYDRVAIMEPAQYDGRKDEVFKGAKKDYTGIMPGNNPQSISMHGAHVRWQKNEDGLRVRNKRDVWTVTTSSYKEAHFATFPVKLIEPMILAGTSEKGECPKCGAPWTRRIESIKPPTREINLKGPHSEQGQFGRVRQDDPTIIKTIGWSPTCECVMDSEKIYFCPECELWIDIAELSNGCPNCGKTMNPAPYKPIPQIVLDPFSGSGTVGEGCAKHGRNYIGNELKLSYIRLSQKRTSGVQTTMQFDTPAAIAFWGEDEELIEESEEPSEEIEIVAPADPPAEPAKSILSKIDRPITPKKKTIKKKAPRAE